MGLIHKNGKAEECKGKDFFNQIVDQLLRNTHAILGASGRLGLLKNAPTGSPPYK